MLVYCNSTRSSISGNLKTNYLYNYIKVYFVIFDPILGKKIKTNFFFILSNTDKTNNDYKISTGNFNSYKDKSSY